MSTSTAVTSTDLLPVPVASRSLALGARAHLAALGAVDLVQERRRALRDDRGQGTVEYVALAMLVAALMAGVLVVVSSMKGGGIGQAVVNKVKSAIDGAGKVPKK